MPAPVSRPRGAAGDPVAQADPPISLLIVDDSIVVRTILERMLGGRDEFTIAGTAANVDRALDVLREREVDIVLLDVQMPGTDGLTALPRLIQHGKGAHILIVSALCDDGAAASVNAMTLGATDTLLKPAAGGFGSRFEDALAERLLRIGRRRARPASQSQAPTYPMRPPSTAPLACVAIGASTGGLHALADFFDGLPPAITAPIVVTQHLPPSFMPYFAAQLSEIAGRPCGVAEDGMRIASERILVAPGDAHLRITRSGDGLRVRLDSMAVANGNMPSVDPMLASLAGAVGAGGLAVILTGMGRDGEIGAKSLADVGGEVIAQDAASSVIWGMPGSVARAGITSLIAPPARLAAHVALRWKRGA